MLTLNVKSNGEIAVSLNLTASLQSNHDVEQCITTPLSRKSGRGSRNRRRRRRAAARSSGDVREACISSNVRSEEDQCSAIKILTTDPPDFEELAIECHPAPSLQFSHVSEHQEANDETTTSNLGQDTTEDTAVQQCCLCLNQVVLFSTRADF